MPQAVCADPFPWPISGKLDPNRAAVLVIDMQADFCASGGYMDQLGYDIAGLQCPIEPIVSVLGAARKVGVTVIHTRQGYREDLADFPPFRRARKRFQGAKPGADGPPLRRGSPGWNIISELAPVDGEPVVDKRANGAFHGTDLAYILRARSIECLAFCGNTIDVCVHTTLRDANDRGFECLLLSDCCGCVDPDLHKACVDMVKVEGGVFGCVANAATFVSAILDTPKTDDNVI